MNKKKKALMLKDIKDIKKLLILQLITSGISKKAIKQTLVPSKSKVR
jgi:hypothetical protein